MCWFFVALQAGECPIVNMLDSCLANQGQLEREMVVDLQSVLT